MKKKLITLGLVIVMLMQVLLLASCGQGERFGKFGYNGHYLTAFANKEITSAEAKDIIGENYASTNKVVLLSDISAMDRDQPKPSDEFVDSLMAKYASVDVITKYYVTGQDKQFVKEDKYLGTDFKNMIVDNQVVPFGQLVAKGIVVFDDLIDYMETRNALFIAEKNHVAPFKNVFTYHTDPVGNIVIRTNDFREIPSSVGGGVGCAYLQNVEILYDDECKISKWQTSLGVYTATPEGTLQQGYIVEIEFKWNVKQ